MDPTANLAEQLRVAQRLAECEAGIDCTPCFHDAERLAELVLALDEWMARGGFPPAQWKRRDK